MMTIKSTERPKGARGALVHDFIDTWRGSGSWSCDIGALCNERSEVASDLKVFSNKDTATTTKIKRQRVTTS